MSADTGMNQTGGLNQSGVRFRIREGGGEVCRRMTELGIRKSRKQLPLSSPFAVSLDSFFPDSGPCCFFFFSSSVSDGAGVRRHGHNTRTRPTPACHSKESEAKCVGSDNLGAQHVQDP